MAANREELPNMKEPIKLIKLINQNPVGDVISNPELYNGCPGKCENENLPANDPCTPYCHCYTPEEVSQGYTEAPETPGEGMPPQGGVGKPNISKLPQKGVLPKGKGMKNSKNLGRVNTFRRKANLGRK